MEAERIKALRAEAERGGSFEERMRRKLTPREAGGGAGAISDSSSDEAPRPKPSAGPPGSANFSEGRSRLYHHRSLRADSNCSELFGVQLYA